MSASIGLKGKVIIHPVLRKSNGFFDKKAVCEKNGRNAFGNRFTYKELQSAFQTYDANSYS